MSGNCNSHLWQKREEPNTFVTYLKNAGYETFHAGKYLNQVKKMYHAKIYLNCKHFCDIPFLN